MILFGVVFAILFHPLIPWAAWYLTARAPKSPAVVGSMVVMGAAGVFIGSWVYEFEYFLSPDLRVAGFPLPVAFFERNEYGGWRDYVGAFSPFAFFFNLVLGATLPLVWLAVLLALSARVNRPSRSA